MIRNLLSRCTTPKTSSAAPQEVAGGNHDIDIPAAEQQSNNLHTTSPTGQLLRPRNPKKHRTKQQQPVGTTSAPSCGGPHTIGHNRSTPVSGRSTTADQESKAATTSSSDGAKTSSEGTGGLDESTVTTSSITLTDTHSRASSGASSDSLGQADDATVERYASPASGAPSAAGKLTSSLAAASTSAEETTVVTAPKVEGTTAAPPTRRKRCGQINKWLGVWYNQIAQSPELMTAIRTGAAPPSPDALPLSSPGLPSTSDTAGGLKPLTEGPMANSSSSAANNSTDLPQDSTSTLPADVPLLRPLFNRLFRLHKGAPMNVRQLANDVVALSAQAGTTARTTSTELSLRALSTQASTSHPQALNPTDLCEGITHQAHELATLVAALEKAMDQLQVLKKAQEESAHDEVLRVMCELVGEKQAKELAAAEAENCRRRMEKAEAGLAHLTARREEAEAALEGLRARHEELEKAHATTLQAHAAQCNVTAGLLTDLQAKRVETKAAQRGLKAKDVNLQSLKQERDDALTRVEVGKAKHSEETQRLSKALQHGQERVRELQAKEQRQAERLETLQGSLVSAQGLVAQYQERLQAAQALAREEAQRADEAEALVEEERGRADAAEAEAQEERRRAEEAAAQVVTETRRANVAEAQNMAKSQELQEADAYAAQLQASLNEAQDRQGEAAQIEELQAQIAQLTTQLQQAQALVGQRDAQLVQAQGDTKSAQDLLQDDVNSGRRLQASQVLVDAAEHRKLLRKLEKGGITDIQRSPRGNRRFDRLHGMMAGTPPVPVTIRLYLAKHAHMVQVVAADLERRKEEMGVSKVVQMQVGGEEGMYLVLLVGLNSNMDFDILDTEFEAEAVEEEEEDDEEEKEGGEVQGQAAGVAKPDHFKKGTAELYTVQDGEEGSEDAQAIKDDLGASRPVADLGAGAFGWVGQRAHRATGENFCIKIQRMDHGFVRGCVVMERRLGQLLRDAEYCVTFETAWIGPRYSIARMPFLEGSKALDKVKEEGFFAEGPFLAFRLESVMRQLLAAIRELKDMGVAHRDIKSPNILLIRREGEDENDFGIKMIDFGLATDRCDEAPLMSVGTAGYMPVEALMPTFFKPLGLLTGVYGDLFSLSETVFRLLPLDLCLSTVAGDDQAVGYLQSFHTACADYMARLPTGTLTTHDHGVINGCFHFYPQTVATALQALVAQHPHVINESTAKAIAIGLRYKREQRTPMINSTWDDLVNEDWLPAA